MRKPIAALLCFFFAYSARAPAQQTTTFTISSRHLATPLKKNTVSVAVAFPEIRTPSCFLGMSKKFGATDCRRAPVDGWMIWGSDHDSEFSITWLIAQNDAATPSVPEAPSTKKTRWNRALRRLLSGSSRWSRIRHVEEIPGTREQCRGGGQHRVYHRLQGNVLNSRVDKSSGSWSSTRRRSP